MTYEFIKEQVDTIVRKCKTSSPLEICDIKGIKVLRYDLPEVTRGFCLSKKEGCCIVINNSVTDDELPFCLAHELGHAMLHAGINYMFICSDTNFLPGSFETEADCFALQLLLRQKKTEFFGKTRSELAAELKVPEKLLEKWADKLF